MDEFQTGGGILTTSEMFVQCQILIQSIFGEGRLNECKNLYIFNFIASHKKHEQISTVCHIMFYWLYQTDFKY